MSDDLLKKIDLFLIGEDTLEYKERKKLSKGSFAIPSKAPGSGSYPIPDISHGRNALARVAQNGTPGEQAQVRRAVYSKFPELKKNKEERED
jgi:hypothetical protein